MDTFESVKKIVEEKLKELNYTLVSFKLNKGKELTLEVIIDKDTPINLDDITSVSNEISNILDEHDFINGAYMLDVSSAGIEKPIDINHFEKYLNQYINVHLIHPFKGESYIEGTLIENNEENITLQYFLKGKKTKTVLNKTDIDKARLAIKF